MGILERPIRVIFEPSVFGKIPAATRLNISYEIVNPQYQEFFEAIDTKVLHIIASRSATFSRRL